MIVKSFEMKTRIGLPVLCFSVFLLFSFSRLQAGRDHQESLPVYRVVVEGLRKSQGTVNILLFKGAEGFPEEENRAFRQQTVKASGNSVIFKFSDLPSGDYAFAILHDENNNGKMDKNFLGIPKEGFAFSNGYKPRSPKISFQNARITIDKKTAVTRVEMIYYL